MPVASIGPVSLPDVNMETWLIKFDKDGSCTSPETRQALLTRLKQVGDTPVILFSHGWNNDFDDATELYRKFLVQLQQHLTAQPIGKSTPLFIGVLWPSIWLSFDSGLRMAAAGDPGPSVSEQQLVNDLSDSLPDPVLQQRFHHLMSQVALNVDEVQELAGLLQNTWQVDAEFELNEAASAPTKDEITRALNALQISVALPDDDDDLPAGGVIGAAGAAGVAKAAGGLGYFDPRVALRLASVYKMKDRAGVVGKVGVSSLITDALDSINGELHLVGHSYGCKVVLSGLTHSTSRKKKVSSALLLQPAISHLCFASQLPKSGKPAGYAGILVRISHSLLMTYSAKDFPLHNTFHLALRRDGDLGEVGIAGDAAASPVPSMYAALGGYGPRRSEQRLIGQLPEPRQPFDLPRGSAPVAFDGSDGQINGHSDVTSPYTTWLMYLQLKS